MYSHTATDSSRNGGVSSGSAHGPRLDHHNIPNGKVLDTGPAEAASILIGGSAEFFVRVLELRDLDNQDTP